MGSVYGSDFQAGHQTGRSSSAGVVVPWLIERFAPARVLDVGCGRGEWLAEFARAGVDVHGVDGPWVRTAELVIDPDGYTAVDLGRQRVSQGRYDLALCLEVAEHLPPQVGERLIADLVEAAPVVAFSAAVPGQGGEGHVNERWQSYWAELFGRHGYMADLQLRGLVWAREDVEWWYAQNLLLYSRSAQVRATLPPMIDVVHPRCLTHALDQERTGRKALAALAAAGKARLRAAGDKR